MLTCPTAGSFVIVVAIAIAVVGLVHKMKKVTNRMSCSSEFVVLQLRFVSIRH